MHGTYAFCRWCMAGLVLLLCVARMWPNARASVGAGEGQGYGDDREAVRAFASTYLKNRDAFHTIDCRYQLRHFAVDNEDDVFLARVTPDASAEGLLVRDRAKERREVDISDADLEEGFRRGHTIFDTKHQLLEGGRGLYYARDLNGSVLYSSAFPATDLVIGPFSWGLFSYPEGKRNVDAVLRELDVGVTASLVEEPCPDERHAAVPSRELVGIEYVKKVSSGMFRQQFFLAPNHGNLPVVCLKRLNGRIQEKVVITDIRQVDADRFFPLRNIHFRMAADGSDRIAWATETRVIKLEVDRPVDPALFQLQFAKNTVVRDGADDTSQFRIEGPRTVTLDDLDDLFARAAEQSKKEAAIDKAIREKATLEEPPGVGRKSRRTLLIVNAVLVAVVGLVLVMFSLHKRRRSDAGGARPM